MQRQLLPLWPGSGSRRCACSQQLVHFLLLEPADGLLLLRCVCVSCWQELVLAQLSVCQADLAAAREQLAAAAEELRHTHREVRVFGRGLGGVHCTPGRGGLTAEHTVKGDGQTCRHQAGRQASGISACGSLTAAVCHCTCL